MLKKHGERKSNPSTLFLFRGKFPTSQQIAPPQEGLFSWMPLHSAELTVTEL